MKKIITLMVLSLAITAICGCTDSSNKSTPTNNTTNANTSTNITPQNSSEPLNVTINQLYSSNIPTGTVVRVYGSVKEADTGSFVMADFQGQRVMVKGPGLNAYIGQSVTVTGKYEGTESSLTPSGSFESLPTIEFATKG